MKTMITLCQLLAGLRDAAIVVACLVYIQPANDSPDAITDSTDTAVILRIGSQSYSFAPNVAKAVGADMVELASEIEGSAE